MANGLTKVRYLHEENGRYFARVTVPVGLHDQFKNNAVKRALNTSDRRAAIDRLPVVVAAIKAEFKAKLGQMEPTHLEDADPESVTRLIKEGDQGWLQVQQWADFLKTDVGRQLVRTPPDGVPPREAWEPLLKLLGTASTPEIMARLHRDMPTVWRNFCATPVGTALLNRDVDAYANDDFFEFLLGANKVTVGEVLGERIKRSIPDVLIPKPQVPKHVKPFVQRYQAPPPETPITLWELIKAFESDPGRMGNTPNTRRNYTTSFAILLDVLGATKNVRHIRRRPDIVKIRDIILNLPPHAKSRDEFAGMSYERIAATVKRKRENAEAAELLDPITRRKYLRNVGTLFTFALNENLIDTHPAQALSVGLDGDEDHGAREGFSAAELKKLFPKGYALDGNAWIPLVALFTGMRPTEVTQLDTSDVYEVDGVWVFDLNVVKGDKRLKNKMAARRIPLHRRLIELNFLQYHAARQQAGESKLFAVTRHGEGYYGSVRDRFAAWFKATGTTKTFHSFRHTWNTAMIGANTQENLRKIMGGWTVGKGVDTRVYLTTHHLSLVDMKAEIDKIDFGLFSE